MRVMGWNEIRTSDAEKERQATLQLKPADETSFLEKVKLWKDKGGTYQGYINELKKRGMRPPHQMDGCHRLFGVTDRGVTKIMQNLPNKEPNFDEIGMPAEAQGEDTDSLLGKEVLGTRGIYDLKDGSGTIGEVELYEWFQLMEDIHGMPKWKSHEIITSHVDVPDKWVRQVLDSIYGYSGGYDVPDEEADTGWSWDEVGELILDPEFNISNPSFVQDFFSTAWNVVTGMRHLPGIAKGIGSDMVKEGFWTADLWDIITEKDKNAQRAKWKRYEKNFPRHITDFG